MQVVQLHNHSEYSILDGRSRVSELVAGAKALGQPAVALTDHGGMYGALDFYRQATAAGVKPILGVEAYVAAGPMHRKDAQLDKAGSSTHLTLLAMDQAGFRNLLALTTKAHTEGFYYRPRIDFDCLAKHAEGVIILSGCLGSELSSLILEDKAHRAELLVDKYVSAFGPDRYFLEIHNHGLAKQKKVNDWILATARKFGVSVVAACDSHYVRKEDAKAHDVLLAIQTGSTLDDPNRFRVEPYGEYYLKSAEEMYQAFSGAEHAVASTLGVADMCNVKIESAKEPLPDIFGDADETLLQKVKEGLTNRYGKSLRRHHWERAKYELDVIRQVGYARYFLVVEDYVRYARNQGVMAVPRGSVAGSLCMYAIGVCDIDPVRYDIMFERFLHDERRGMPDVDMDFADDRRDDVIEYITDKYGKDRVAHVGTFSTLGARAAVKDVARVMGIDFARINSITKAFPSKLDVTIQEALDSPELKSILKNDQEMTEVMEMAGQIEGLVRSFGTHAAGMVVSGSTMSEILPLQLPPKNSGSTFVTQWDNNNQTALVESIGLSKFDFLGLANLTIIRNACKSIYERHGLDLYGESGEKLYSVLPTDYTNDMAKRTYDMLASGETTSLFQIESGGMRRVLRLVRPTRITDLPAVVALFRPGPMENIPIFASAKHGKIESPKYHPDVDKILEETYGVITYQDQVLEIARKIAGFSWGEVDVLRKGMGKKMPEVVEKQRQKFIDGCVSNGHDRELANILWDTMSPFAGYGFNKAHAYCYGYVAYITAFLKANFPSEYMCAVLSQESGNMDKIAETMTECKRMGIDVLLPDINESGEQFTLVGDKIRFGLGAIANMGDAAISSIIASRPFASIGNLVESVNIGQVNSRVLQNLAKSGALDLFGDRASIIATIPAVLEAKRKRGGNSSWKQFAMFDMEIPLVKSKEYTLLEKLEGEREVLGIFVSAHPLDSYRNSLEEICTDTSKSLEGRSSVIVGGMISRLHLHTQKNGKPMAFVDIEDPLGQIPCVIFSSVYEKFSLVIHTGAVLAFEGEVRTKDDVQTVIVNNVHVVKMDRTIPDSKTEMIRLSMAGMSAAKKIATMWHIALASTENAGPTLMEIFLEDGAGELPLRIRTDDNGASIIRSIAERIRG